MSLTSTERDAAFLFYSLAYGGTVFFYPFPDVPFVVQDILAAAISVGAGARLTGAGSLSRDEVEQAVLGALNMSEEPPDDEENAPDSHDPTTDRLAGYAEGRAAELDALGEWEAEERTRKYGDESHQALLNVLRHFIASRLAMAPKPGMTALEVLARVEKWRTEAGGPMRLADFCADLRREIEGGCR